MSEGKKKEKFRISGMLVAGIAICVVVLGFAIGFPAWLSVYCSVPDQSENIIPGHFSVIDIGNKNTSANARKPSISNFSSLKGVPTPPTEYHGVSGSYYPPKEPYEWGRQFWCGVNASDYFIAFFTLILAAVTGFLWYSTHLLWKSGEMQIGAAIVASNAADLSARAAIATEPPPLVGTYGGNPHNNVPTRYSAFEDLKFSNRGRTHAYPIRISLGWCIAVDLPDVPAFERIIESPRDSMIAADKTAQVGTRIICVESTAAQIEAMRNDQTFIWLFGKLEYADFMEAIQEIWFFWKWSKVEGQDFYNFQRPVTVPAAYTTKQKQPGH